MDYGRIELIPFIVESNKIEDIHREPSRAEIKLYESFLALPAIRVEDLCNFVNTVQPGARLRDRSGMNVVVGNHMLPPGGLHIKEELRELLFQVNFDEDAALIKQPYSPWDIHVAYEILHPFMDGNGRSGRALWLWMMVRDENPMCKLGFLHAFYYQTLENSR